MRAVAWLAGPRAAGGGGLPPAGRGAGRQGGGPPHQAHSARTPEDQRLRGQIPVSHRYTGDPCLTNRTTLSRRMAYTVYVCLSIFCPSLCISAESIVYLLVRVPCIIGTVSLKMREGHMTVSLPARLSAYFLACLQKCLCQLAYLFVSLPAVWLTVLALPLGCLLVVFPMPAVVSLPAWLMVTCLQFFACLSVSSCQLLAFLRVGYLYSVCLPTYLSVPASC